MDTDLDISKSDQNDKEIISGNQRSVSENTRNKIIGPFKLLLTRNRSKSPTRENKSRSENCIKPPNSSKTLLNKTRNSMELYQSPLEPELDLQSISEKEKLAQRSTDNSPRVERVDRKSPQRSADNSPRVERVERVERKSPQRSTDNSPRVERKSPQRSTDNSPRVERIERVDQKMPMKSVSGSSSELRSFNQNKEKSPRSGMIGGFLEKLFGNEKPRNNINDILNENNGNNIELLEENYVLNIGKPIPATNGRLTQYVIFNETKDPRGKIVKDAILYYPLYIIEIFDKMVWGKIPLPKMYNYPEEIIRLVSFNPEIIEDSLLHKNPLTLLKELHMEYIEYDENRRLLDRLMEERYEEARIKEHLRKNMIKLEIETQYLIGDNIFVCRPYYENHPFWVYKDNDTVISLPPFDLLIVHPELVYLKIPILPTKFENFLRNFELDPSKIFNNGLIDSEYMNSIGEYIDNLSKELVKDIDDIKSSYNEYLEILEIYRISKNIVDQTNFLRESYIKVYRYIPDIPLNIQKMFFEIILELDPIGSGLFVPY